MTPGRRRLGKGYVGYRGSARPVTEEDGLPTSKRIADLPLHRRILFFLASMLVVLGIVFVLWWALDFGVLIDNGVYAVSATLILFGLAGMWLIMPNPPVSTADVPSSREPARP